MRAIILALASSERDERNEETREGQRKEHEKKDTKGEKRRKSDVAQLLLFKPLLQYAIESVQKCPSHLVTSCAVCVSTKEDAKFAKALCEKMTTTYNNASSSSVPSSSSPLMAGTSTGAGMYSITASSSACTPLFLNAEPHIVTTISPVSVRARRPR